MVLGSSPVAVTTFVIRANAVVYIWSLYFQVKSQPHGCTRRKQVEKLKTIIIIKKFKNLMITPSQKCANTCIRGHSKSRVSRKTAFFDNPPPLLPLQPHVILCSFSRQPTSPLCNEMIETIILHICLLTHSCLLTQKHTC